MKNLFMVLFVPFFFFSCNSPTEIDDSNSSIEIDDNNSCNNLSNTTWKYNDETYVYQNTTCTGDRMITSDFYWDGDPVYWYFNNDSLTQVDMFNNDSDCNNSFEYYEINLDDCDNVYNETDSYMKIDQNQNELSVFSIVESFMDGDYLVEGFCIEKTFIQWENQNFICE